MHRWHSKRNGGHAKPHNRVSGACRGREVKSFAPSVLCTFISKICYTKCV